MNFKQLKTRVERSEQVVDGRMLQTRLAWTSLHDRWQQAWTPPRIIIAGAVLGFISGKARPARALRQVGRYANPKVMQLVTSVSGLVAALQSTFAAATAKTAASTADEAATTADVAAGTTSTAVGAAAAAPGVAAVGPDITAVPRSDRSRADPQWDRQPSPAEAATDMSER